MSPETSEMMTRARKLLAAARRGAGEGSPSPEATEEAALGSAIMCLLSSSYDRMPTADNLGAVVGVVLTLAKHQGEQPERVIASIAERVRELWPTIEFIHGLPAGAAAQ
jgi:hypothetical protein